MTSWFFDRMQGFGAADAIVFNGTTYSYADLVARVEQWTRTLDEQGVAADEVVALEGATSIAACAGLLALVARGAVVVPLAPLPEAKRTEFHEVAEVERVITLDPATQLPSITTTGRRADNEFYRTLRARRTPAWSCSAPVRPAGARRQSWTSPRCSPTTGPPPGPGAPPASSTWTTSAESTPCCTPSARAGP